MNEHPSGNFQQVVEGDKGEKSYYGGRCITANSIVNDMGVIPREWSRDDPGAVRRASADGSGGAVAAPPELAPPSSIGHFKTSSTFSRPKWPSVSCVVGTSDHRTMPSRRPDNLPPTGSLDTACHQQQQQQQRQHQQNRHHHQQQQQHQHHQQKRRQLQLQQQQQHQQKQLQQQHQQQQQQQQRQQQQQLQDVLAMQQQNHHQNQVLRQQRQQPKASLGAQRDVSRIITPQGSSHSLDMGYVDLLTSGRTSVMTESDSSLVPPASGDKRGGIDSPLSLSCPIPPPQPVQAPFRGSSFDATHSRGAVDGDFSSGKTVLDLSDMENLLRSPEAEEKAAAGAKPTVSAPLVGTGAYAGAGSRQKQEVSLDQTWDCEGMLPLDKVIIEPSRKECDFQGRPFPTSNTASPRSSTLPSHEGQCRLVFTGLEKTGHDFRSLRVTAHFGADAVHKVGKITGPIKIGANGQAYAAVCYPSMQEIWPEMYSTGNVRQVQVDVAVQIRSDCGDYQYIGPQLKVYYRRVPLTGGGADIANTGPFLEGRRIGSCASMAYTGDSANISSKSVDYSCGERASDMCYPVFGGGGASHQLLPDDPNDLINEEP